MIKPPTLKDFLIVLGIVALLIAFSWIAWFGFGWFHWKLFKWKTGPFDRGNKYPGVTIKLCIHSVVNAPIIIIQKSINDDRNPFTGWACLFLAVF